MFVTKQQVKQFKEIKFNQAITNIRRPVDQAGYQGAVFFVIQGT
jgi:hypothetical protein